MWLLGGVLLTACGTVDERRAAYTKATTLPALELPPDLLLPPVEGGGGVSTGGGAPSEGTLAKTLLPPPVVGVQVMRDGAQRWLVLQGEAQTWWPQLRAFWQKAGFPLLREDPALGLMETDWVENRSGLPETLLRKVFESLYDSSTRDKFIMRLERGVEAGTTEIYINHLGLEQVTQGESLRWLPRASDPALAAEMYQRMAISLGVSAEEAARIHTELVAPVRGRVQWVEGPPPALRVGMGFANAWRRTGDAVDKMGLTLTDHDRTRGLYQLEYRGGDGAQEGWLRRIFKGGTGAAHSIQLVLHNEGESTRIKAQGVDGKPLDEALERELLLRLQQELQ